MTTHTAARHTSENTHLPALRQIASMAGVSVVFAAAIAFGTFTYANLIGATVRIASLFGFFFFLFLVVLAIQATWAIWNREI
jgi:hypothetical protein